MHKVWGVGAHGGRGLALYCGCCSKRCVVRWGAHTCEAYCLLHFLTPREWRDPFYGKRGPAKMNLWCQRRHRWRHQWRHAAALIEMGGGTTRPVPRHAAARGGTDKNGRRHHTGMRRHAAAPIKMGGGTTRPVPRHAAARGGTDKNGRRHHTPFGVL